MADELKDLEHEAAKAADKDYGATKEGRDFLSSSLAVPTLDKYEEATKLRAENVRDALTGLFNLRHLKDRLAIMTSSPEKRKFALLFADTDNLKSINDTLGHPQGNEVLIGLSRFFENKIRPNEDGFVARYGGDEFVFVIPGIEDIQAAKVRAEEIRSSVEGARFRTKDEPAKVTVSIGVIVWDGKLTPVDMLQKADDAMYKAKRSGRNTVIEVGK